MQHQTRPIFLLYFLHWAADCITTIWYWVSARLHFHIIISSLYGIGIYCISFCFSIGLNQSSTARIGWHCITLLEISTKWEQYGHCSLPKWCVWELVVNGKSKWLIDMSRYEEVLYSVKGHLKYHLTPECDTKPVHHPRPKSQLNENITEGQLHNIHINMK